MDPEPTTIQVSILSNERVEFEDGFRTGVLPGCYCDSLVLTFDVTGKNYEKVGVHSCRNTWSFVQLFILEFSQNLGTFFTQQSIYLLFLTVEFLTEPTFSLLYF